MAQIFAALQIVSFGVSSVKASEEDEAMIKELQRNAVFRNTNMAAAQLVGAQAQAMQDAAKNSAGAFTGFMGMGMAQQSGGVNAQTLFQMGAQQPQAQQAAPADGWKCSCGAMNTGKFCTQCGAKKPEVPAGPAPAARLTRASSAPSAEPSVLPALRCTAAISAAGSPRILPIPPSSAPNAAIPLTITTCNKPMDEKILSSYHAWCAHASADPDLTRELAAMAQDEAALSDAFYRDLAFGTGGLRGVIGAGTNRMNVYTVAKASQGLANYVVRRFSPEARRIAVSYDSRIKSDLFARVAAGVFAANGISVFIYPHLMPTPCLSYAVRALGCAAGVMVTASHNPAKYNGYKVYGSDGCQITTEAADEALREIERLDIFADVKQADFDTCLADGSIQWIPDSVYDNFTRAVRGQSVLTADDPINRDVSIVYTPLNGTGLQPVTRALRESGFTRITVVPEQEQPDGHFPDLPLPQPRNSRGHGVGHCLRAKASG